MKQSKKWILLTQDDNLVLQMKAELGISEIVAKLLINRGYRDIQKAKIFLEKSEVFCYNPFLMKDMDKAASRIALAIRNKEHILIYGDYDVDGVTSVTILLRYLQSYGVTADFYIPLRETEGYGLNKNAFDAIAKSGVDLVITVDSGITAVDEVEYAVSLGLDIIVTDHHQCEAILPKALAVVNPHRPDCSYPFKELAGVGVAFKLICAIELLLVNGGEYNLQTIKEMCRYYMEYVAIGTIADVMPVVDENRIFLHIGLNLLKTTNQMGIKSLFRASGIETDDSPRFGVTKKITATNVAFTIAPRINAAGRMGDAGRAVQLFMTDSPILADVISEELCAANRERQLLDNQILKEVEDRISANPALLDDSVMVIDGDDWRIGVVGIATSHLTEKYGKPCVLITFSQGEEIGKGSARSIPGFNIVNAFSACADLLEKYGGHELAAGLSVKKQNIAEFRLKINEYAKKISNGVMPEAVTEIDCILEKEDVNLITANEISLLEPFGVSNPAPIFLLQHVKIEDMVLLSEGKHTKLMIDRTDMRIPVLFFNRNLQAEGDFFIGDYVDIISSLDINEYKGVSSVQLIAKDLKVSDSEMKAFEKEENDTKLILSGKMPCDDEHIPNRNDFAAFYLYLKQKGKETDGLSVKKIMHDFPSFSHIKINILLSVLKDTELIALEKPDSIHYRFSVKQSPSKINLENNALLTSIQKTQH